MDLILKHGISTAVWCEEHRPYTLFDEKSAASNVLVNKQ